MKNTSRLLVLSIASCLLAACAGVNETVQTTPATQAADQMLASGHARDAARAYESQAGGAGGALHDVLEVRAANAWMQAGDSGAARRDFAYVNPKHLGGDDALRYRLLHGEFAIADGHAAQAAGDFAIGDAPVPHDLALRWYESAATAQEAAGDAFDAAASLAVLETVLPKKRDPKPLQARIRKLLAAVDNTALQRGTAALPQSHPLYADAARTLVARGLPLPHPLAAGPGLPSDANRPPADEDGYRPPLKVALLLPSNGAVAAAGAAVRDGFMSAYYAESRRRPDVQFYDSSDSAGGAVGAYRKAVADGSDFVVGPLGRDQVAALFDQTDVPVPILALNRSPKAAPPGSVSFSLAPEDEGVAAATRMLDHGLRRAVAFTARDDNAARALAAFRDAYTHRGGGIVAEAVISDAGPNYGTILKDTLAKTGDQYDAIFLALKAPAARLIATQLPTNGYRAVPRESTSLILSGGGNARLDQELDGIEYPELAWILHPVNGLPESASLGSHLPSARGGGARLFAFGADAYRISSYLEMLGSSPRASVRGATGELRLDGLGNVARDSEWAVFSGGRGHAAPEGGLQAEPVRN